jgi:CheY-like chemotaxis protein
MSTARVQAQPRGSCMPWASVVNYSRARSCGMAWPLATSASRMALNRTATDRRQARQKCETIASRRRPRSNGRNMDALAKLIMGAYAMINMEAIAKLLSALASLAWPLIFGIFLIKCLPSLKLVIESARNRRFTVKVGGNELTMEEASKIQGQSITDLQAKFAILQSSLPGAETASVTSAETSAAMSSESHKPGMTRILWVDDIPNNNSYLVATLNDHGIKVDTALSTEEALEKFKSSSYDAIISDMGRPEGPKAGLDLTQKIRAMDETVPIYISTTSANARYLRREVMEAGANNITSSGTTLLSYLLPAAKLKVGW